DFTGTHAQVPGPVNCTMTALVSGVRALYLAITNPGNPVNDGAFRSLRITCPPRTIFSAERPAPVSTYWETMLYVADLIWKAMARWEGADSGLAEHRRGSLSDDDVWPP